MIFLKVLVGILSHFFKIIGSFFFELFFLILKFMNFWVEYIYFSLILDFSDPAQASLFDFLFTSYIDMYLNEVIDLLIFLNFDSKHFFVLFLFFIFLIFYFYVLYFYFYDYISFNLHILLFFVLFYFTYLKMVIVIDFIFFLYVYFFLFFFFYFKRRFSFNFKFFFFYLLLFTFIFFLYFNFFLYLFYEPFLFSYFSFLQFSINFVFLDNFEMCSLLKDNFRNFEICYFENDSFFSLKYQSRLILFYCFIFDQ